VIVDGDNPRTDSPNSDLSASSKSFAFDLRLALSLLHEPRDFDGGLLQLPDNGRDPAG